MCGNGERVEEGAAAELPLQCLPNLVSVNKRKGDSRLKENSKCAQLTLISSAKMPAFHSARK